MIRRVGQGQFSGLIRVPPSKSHTIRALIIASLANGVSEIRYPLDSLDISSCVNACRVLGAEITEKRSTEPLCPNPPASDGTKLCAYTVKGNAGFKDAIVAVEKGEGFFDVGNSGTTLFFAMAAAAISPQKFRITGDEQIQKRSAAPLLEALCAFGAKAESVLHNGCAPLLIQGPLKGGKARLSCPTSQYLSALLIAAPLAPAGTLATIEVPLLNERPYVEMTLAWLNSQGIPWQASGDFSYFAIPGGASWSAFNRAIPGDFSSAAFPAAAAAISGGKVTIVGLDPDDAQGDKYFLKMLAQMGCTVEWEKTGNCGGEWAVNVSRNGPMHGGTFDLNATPDLLPAAAVCAAFASGDTALVNVAHARIKETDRIAAMAKELAKLGVNCTEKPDALVVHGTGGKFSGLGCPACVIDSQGDHRIAMAFAAAAQGLPAPIEIEGAECADVSYPGFWELVEGKNIFYKDEYNE